MTILQISLLIYVVSGIALFFHELRVETRHQRWIDSDTGGGPLWQHVTTRNVIRSLCWAVVPVLNTVFTLCNIVGYIRDALYVDEDPL